MKKQHWLLVLWKKQWWYLLSNRNRAAFSPPSTLRGLLTVREPHWRHGSSSPRHRTSLLNFMFLISSSLAFSRPSLLLDNAITHWNMPELLLPHRPPTYPPPPTAKEHKRHLTPPLNQVFSQTVLCALTAVDQTAKWNLTFLWSFLVVISRDLHYLSNRIQCITVIKMYIPCLKGTLTFFVNTIVNTSVGIQVY